MNYYLSKTVEASFDNVIVRVVQELKKEGFGVLTEIDVRATLKQKLNVDFRPYVILGACNPPVAYQALLAEDKIGVLLPCNVIVQELKEGQVEVAAMDPATAMQVVESDKLHDVVVEVRARLKAVLDSL